MNREHALKHDAIRGLPGRGRSHVSALLFLAAAVGAAACTAYPEEPGQQPPQEDVGTTSEAVTIAGLFPTGVNAAGTPLAPGAIDPHYTLTSNDAALPGPNAITIAPAVVMGSGWTPNTATSNWISGQASAVGKANGVYTYTTTFTLTGVVVGTAKLKGTWACDDTCVINLNGTQVAANNGPMAWGSVVAFNIPVSPAFIAGVNTLQFVATNSGGQVTGLQVVTISGDAQGTACTLDTQCLATQFCNTVLNQCNPKLSNGTPVPTIGGHTPPLTGMCNVLAGAAVCVSGVCDVADNDCGYANGHGPCTAANGGVVCRSGVCGASLTCVAAGGCNTDVDCSGGKWCNEATHVCTNKFANGAVMPSDAPHMNPTLNGMCTVAAALLVCQSGVCDVADNRCGYADTDGPCTAANGPTVCRSGACSVDLTCVTGCNVDGDCTNGDWCDESTHTCSPKIANGGTIPNDPPHIGPVLNGMCSDPAATLVCLSGVCDTNDNRCGYAYGDGPCTIANGPAVCRMGVCSPNGLVCVPDGGCFLDADCMMNEYCDTPSYTCVPKLMNGQTIPTVPGHTPTLDGTCTMPAGASACLSGVCDPKDNECGFANGDGPCTGADGMTVCRSMLCATMGPNMGVCVACDVDAACMGMTPVCDPKTNTCVQCTPGDDMQCAGQSPVCDASSSSCVPCDGDLGSGTKDPCGKMDAPTCSLGGPTKGTCGKCMSDADCTGHPGGTVCNTTTGTCGPSSGCKSDAECSPDQWCNASPGGTGACTPKLANGTPLPMTPSDVAKCTMAVGTRVCKSGVCDPKDDTCGIAVGNGPCASNTQCRNDLCDMATMVCAPPAGCVTDADCPSGDFCKDGACTPKLPDGSACDRATQCQSALCSDKVCDNIVVEGNGILCSAQPANDNGSGFGWMLGGALGLLAAARRRRR